LEACLALTRTDQALRASHDRALITAAIEEANAIDQELCWFNNVPFDVLQTPAPTDDERAEMKDGA
jgi:hypothetical protein